MNKNILRIVVFILFNGMLICMGIAILGGVITETKNNTIVKKVNDINKLSSNKVELGEGLAEKSKSEYAENDKKEKQNTYKGTKKGNDDVLNREDAGKYEIAMYSYSKVKKEDEEKIKESFGLPDGAKVVKKNDYGCIFKWRPFKIEYIMLASNEDTTPGLIEFIGKVVEGVDYRKNKKSYIPMTILYTHNMESNLAKYGNNIVYVDVCINSKNQTIIIDPDTLTVIEYRTDTESDGLEK